MDTKQIGGIAGVVGPVLFVAVFLVEGSVRDARVDSGPTGDLRSS